jgi:hypothetical protein
MPFGAERSVTMIVNRFATTTIGALCGLLLAAPLARAAQHQHMPSPDSQSGMQAVAPGTAEKAEKTIKVGKTGDVTFGLEALVGDLRLKPGRYQIQHRTDGPDHFVHFTEVTKNLPYGQSGGTTAVAHPGEVKCRLEMLDHKVSATTVYTREEGAATRVTKVLIRGENVAHVF